MGALFLDQDSPGGARTMPSYQWAVSTLIREVLADPDLAGRASSGVCSGPGRAGLVGVWGRRRDRRAAPRRARQSAPTAATASASRRWPPPPASSSSRSPSFARARSSRPCSTRAGGVRLLVWWQFPRGPRRRGARRPGRAAGIVGVLFLDQDSQGVHPRCPRPCRRPRAGVPRELPPH